MAEMTTLIDETLVSNSILFINFPDEIVNSDSYHVYKLKPEENLMDVSHRYFNTINLWWTIYYFNNISFPLVITKIQNSQPFLDRIRGLLDGTIIGEDEEMKELNEILRNYYTKYKGMPVRLAITASKQQREAPNQDVIADILSIAENEILDIPYMSSSIKVPTIDLIYKMNRWINDNILGEQK